MKTVYFSALLLCTICCTSFIDTTNDWVLKKYGNGVAVYNREVPGSTIKELKAVTQLQTSLSSIITLLEDRETYPEWVYKCGKSYQVKKISDSEGIYYQNVVAPWPVDNRDFVVLVKVTQDAKTKVVTQTSKVIKGILPEVSGTVRVTEFNALWTLTPIKNGMVNCEYQLLVNPGGSIPAWLINLAAIDGPYETTVNLRSWVFKDKYQKSHLSFIKEP
jgi:hypothetical protein